MTVYFYCCEEAYTFHEDIVAIAIGLKELGIPFFGNRNFRRISRDSESYVIQNNPDVTPDDCDIVIVPRTWPLQILPETYQVVERPLPEKLFHKGKKYRTVYLDGHDGHKTLSWRSEYRQFDLILRSKLNGRAWHPENVKPWALGVFDWMVKLCEGAPQFSDRRRVVLVNFGAAHSYEHKTRLEAKRRFLPELEQIIPFDRTKDNLSLEPEEPYITFLREQTGMKVSQNYYNRLKNSQAVACFCGELIPPMPWDPQGYMVGGNKAKLRRAFYDFLKKFDSRPQRSVQWDSFRVWEAWVAGCATINLDLELYGVELPVMPENWKHYIGVDLAQPKKALERLRDEPEILEQVALQGRNWALKHYSPRAQALQMLKYLDIDIESLT